MGHGPSLQGLVIELGRQHVQKNSLHRQEMRAGLNVVQTTRKGQRPLMGFELALEDADRWESEAGPPKSLGGMSSHVD